MRLNIDNLLQTSAGVTLSTLSISGLMCINSICSKGGELHNCLQTSSNTSSLNCFRIN